MTAQLNTQIDDREPVLSMMVKPRETFRYTLDCKSFSYSLYIGAVGGFASALISLYQTKYPFPYSLGEIVYSSFITGVLYFMIANLVIAFMLAKIGAAFGGTASFKEMFQMMCLTIIPYIWLMPVILFWMQYSMYTFFYIPHDGFTLGEVIWSYTGGFLILIASIWTFVLSIIGISEIHRFSKWKAFFTLFIASIGAVMIIGLLVAFIV